MRISNIQLENWKNFTKVNVALGPRMFLIGPNASGKSNFLDAFRFLHDVAETGLARAVEKRGGISYIRNQSARRNPVVSIQLEFDAGWTYRLDFNGIKGKAPELVAEVAERPDADAPSGKRLVLNRPDEADTKDRLRLTQTALE